MPIRTLPGGRLRLSFPSAALHLDMERLEVEEVRPLLDAFDSLRPAGRLPLRLLEVPGGVHSSRNSIAPWESRLREDFFSLYGPPLLPLPELLGLMGLGRVAHACIRLYQDAEAATSPQALEAASERFGRALGGTGLRLLVVVASLGVPQVLPKVPQGGIWTLLSPLRHAPAGGPALESVATAHVLADGSLIVTGVAAGTSATSLCGELAACMMDGADGTSGSGPKLSTRYGKPHTRQNPPHNEAIEQELARREAAGHRDLRKNLAQENAKKERILTEKATEGWFPQAGRVLDTA